MKSRNRIPIALASAVVAVGIVGLAAGTADAGQIYFDDFSGSGADDLHDTTPDISTTGEKWVARSVYKADGSFSWEGFATMSLAFTPDDGRVYTLDAKIENLTGAHWAQFGFGNGQPRVDTDTNWSPRAWHLLRVAEQIADHHTYLKEFTDDAAWSTLNELRYAEPLDARIVLDTTGGTGNWQAAWYAKADSDADYTEVRSASLVTDEDIDSVGVSLFNTEKSGRLLSFSLSDDGASASFAITEIEYNPDPDPESNGTVTLTWRKSGAASYIAKVSTDMGDWEADIGDSLTANEDLRPEDPEHITVTLALPPGPDFAGDLFFRIEEQ